MDARSIINTMRTTPYKFTYAAKLKDAIKNDLDGDCDEILEQLRMNAALSANADIAKPIMEIVDYFRNRPEKKKKRFTAS